MSSSNLSRLPDNLPKPEDDGACSHLEGMKIPSILLRSTDGKNVDLSKIQDLAIVYCYPLTGKPGMELPERWDQIPGARGCTPQACSYRDKITLLNKYTKHVYGLSTQSTEYQKELKDRLHLPFEILSDENLILTQALNLPTFKPEEDTLIKRLTLILKDGIIEKVFYPVFPPDKNVSDVLTWLRKNYSV